MNTNSVDDLFRSSLSTLEKHPPSNAWDRIRQQQEAKRKEHPVWLWFVAAGIALVILAGYSVWINEKSSLRTRISKVEIPKPSIDQLRQINPAPFEGKLRDNAPPIADNKFQVYSLPSQGDQNSIVSNINNEDEGKQSSKKFIETDPVSLTDNKPTVVAQVFSMNEDRLQVPIQEQQPIIPSDITSHTIVVKVTLDDDSLEQPRVSRFTRVFRQLKNARAGERIDWDEVGLNPKSLLAKVDNRHK